jgi:hypothetical protein
VRQCRCTYTALAKDEASGEDINLNFIIEQQEGNPSVEQARQVMETIRNDNSHDRLIKTLSGIGDDAFLLGDELPIYFIMARKGPVVIRLQIKQATKQTSLEELKAFAAKLGKLL